MAGVGRGMSCGPYGHTGSGNHKERNIARRVLSSYLPKIPVAIDDDVLCTTLHVKVSSNKSSKYPKFRQICSDELDKATIQTKADLLSMRTRGVDWPTTGVKLLA